MMNPVHCKIVTFLAHWADMACVWLIVAVSVDRMIIVRLPTVRPNFLNPTVTHVVTFLVVFLAGSVSSWTLFLVHPIETGLGPEPRYQCLVREDHYETYSLFIVVETITGVLLPWCIILTMNATILFKLRSYNSRNNRGSGDSNMSCADNPTEIRNPTLALTPLLDKNRSQLAIPENGEFRSRNTSETKNKGSISDHVALTKSLVIVTTTFVLLNLPSYLCRLFMTVNPNLVEKMVWNLSYFLYYSHHAVLFFLYIFNSSQMRKQLKPMALKILECYCLKTVPDFGHRSV